MLTFRLFGAPEIEANGRSLSLNQQKARALLFYLALTGQPHTRSHLATLLWSEFPDENGRRSLRSVLFQIRQALRAAQLSHLLLAKGELLGLPTAGYTCDVTEFYRLAADGEEPGLSTAVKLYRGPLLEGFSLPDAPLFDEWFQLEEEKLNQTYRAALRQMATTAAARQEPALALTYWQQLVRIDPLDEDAQQQLIKHYLTTGATGQALRQYHQFAAELQAKLGLQPTAFTQSLFQDGLRRQQTGALTTSSSLAVSSNRPALPFVGRDAVLERLLSSSQRAQAGQGCTILLQGDGGLGKSRLLQEFFTRLLRPSASQHPTTEPAWLILQGACSPFDDLISYGPFLEAFQVGDLTDELLAAKPDTPAGRDAFIYRVLQTVRRLSQTTPVVLAIDDLQWANHSTLNLFGLLASRLHDLPLLLVGAAQRPETIPALQRLITVERRHGRLELLTLSPLTEAAVGDLLHELLLDTAAIATLAKWLHTHSDGNPFVLDEMLTQLRAEAILTPLDGQWHLDPGRWLRWRAAFTLPETTHDLVSWRLSRLDSRAYNLLELLAIAGQPLPFDLLADFPGLHNNTADIPDSPAANELPFILDDLLARGLLVEREQNSFTLSHYLLRETLLQRLSQVRRRRLHGQLAQKLAACPRLQGGRFPQWEVARHAVAGEDVVLARQYGLPILSQLPQAYTGAAIVDFLHHLYDLLQPSASAAEQLQLSRTIGAVHQSLGHLAEAGRWQATYLALAQEAGDLTAQATAYFDQGDVALVSNDYLAATAVAEAGLAVYTQLPEDHPAFTRLAGRGQRLLGHALAMEGRDLPAAEHHLQAAATAHRQTRNWRHLCASLFELGNVAAQRGDLRRALELYVEAAEVAEAGESRYMQALAHNNYAYHSLLLGRLEAAQAALARGQELAQMHELLGAFLYLTSTQGEIHLYRAQWEAAWQAFERGLALAEELGNPERQAGYRAGLALAARGRQEPEQALKLLNEALLLLNGRGYWHLRTRLLLWLAETHLQHGRLADAESHLTMALATAVTDGRVLLQLQAERLQAGLLAANGDWPAATRLFNQIIKRATQLELVLEIARTQSAWGQALRHWGANSAQAERLLNQAGHIFVAHQAAAELTSSAITSPITLS